MKFAGAACGGETVGKRETLDREGEMRWEDGEKERKKDSGVLWCKQWRVN